MSDELPEGWAETTVGEVAEDISYGFTAKATTAPVGPRLLRITDIQHGFVQWDSVPFCEIPKGKAGNYSLRNGDIVFAQTGATTGKSFRIRECPEAVFASYLIRVRPSQSTLPEFLAHFFQSASYWNQISENLSGSAQPNCNASKLATISLPLAPLAEQRRIVAKLETLLGKVDASQQRLAKISVLLKRFRQSVLAAACSGRLTADWREENPTIETAEVLLARIKEKRLALAKTQKEKTQIEEVFDERNLRDDEGDVGLDDIPGTWLSCRIGTMGAVCNGSTPSRKQPEFWDGTIPWVSSGEVRNNLISETCERITEAGYEGSSVRLLSRGSVLVAMIGEGKTRGQTAILNIEATINQNIAAAVLDHGLVASAYLWRWFQLQYEATRERGGGSGPQALNCQRVRELPFVLPPLPEQQEIVRRVEGLFALADQLELRLAKARGQVENLTPSLLARAFAGQLVPQDPSDEPAGKLLERIRLTRSQANAQ